MTQNFIEIGQVVLALAQAPTLVVASLLRGAAARRRGAFAAQRRFAAHCPDSYNIYIKFYPDSSNGSRDIDVYRMRIAARRFVILYGAAARRSAACTTPRRFAALRHRA